MTRTLRIAIAAGVLLGPATAALAGSPEGARAFSPNLWFSSPPASTPTTTPPYALTGQPSPKTEPTGWRWVLTYSGKSPEVIPERYPERY